MSEPQDDGPTPQRSADFWRGYKLAETVNLAPTGKPFVPRSSGWGKRIGGKIVRVQDRGQIYDLIGGMGAPTDKPDLTP